MKFQRLINLSLYFLIIFNLSSCNKKLKKPLASVKIPLVSQIQINNKPLASNQKNAEIKKIENKVLKKEPVYKKDPHVKILLDKYPRDNQMKPIKLESTKGFNISEKPNAKNSLSTSSKLEIRKTRSIALILSDNNSKLIRSKQFYIKPHDNKFILNGIPYQGNLSLIMDENNNLLIINKIKLSDYLYSVLRYEIIQSWDMEMQKVQAVASRTYALYHILDARKQGRIFDLKNNNHHQTYNGTHEFIHLRQAIDETHNQIITHGNKPALTMFDSCCGGIIPAHIETDIFAGAPYLARKIACNYCQKCFSYNWKFQLSQKDLLGKFSNHSDLKNSIKNIGTLKNIKITKKDRAGLVREIHIDGEKKSITLTGKKIHSALKPKLRSQTFWVKNSYHPKLGKTFNFEGRGLGHHLGLCQHGARALVNKGWNYKKILSFYYPGTTFGKLDKFI